MLGGEKKPTDLPAASLPGSLHDPGHLEVQAGDHDRRDHDRTQPQEGQQPARQTPVYQALDLYLAGGRTPPLPELDEETKKKLRSLGYVN